MKTLKTILTTIAILVSCFASRASIYIGAPVFNPANGHNYYLLSPDTWLNAEAYAQTLGGHLATINDATEDAWIFQNITSQQPNLNPWFGWNDADGDTTWQWASGEPVTYINWAPGEPNGNGDFYGNLFESSSPFAGKWNNANGGIPIYGIAEVVPEPSALSLIALAGVGYAVRRFRRG